MLPCRSGEVIKSKESSRAVLGSGWRTGGEGRRGAARGGDGRLARGGEGRTTEVGLARFGVETGDSEAGKRVGRPNRELATSRLAGGEGWREPYHCGLLL